MLKEISPNLWKKTWAQNWEKRSDDNLVVAKVYRGRKVHIQLFHISTFACILG